MDESRPLSVRVLRGSDTGPEAPGVDVALSVLTPATAAAAPSADSVELAPGAAFRAVPLLAFLPATSATTTTPARAPVLSGDADGASADAWFLVVGQTRITVGAGQPQVDVHVADLWHVTAAPPASTTGAATVGITRLSRTSASHPSDDTLRSLLAESLARIGHPIPSGPAEAVATHIGKGLSEQSRNAVQDVRALRYSMERTLGASLHVKDSSGLDVALAHVVELSLIASRALDQARDAHRSVAWCYRTDPATYHAYRRDADPRLPVRDGDAEARERPWYPIVVAGARQIENMQIQLAEEVPLLHSVLDASATVAVARDAKAQENFNLVAAVGGIAIGLPALVLALYGLDAQLPLRLSERGLTFLGPLVLASVLAVAAAGMLSPKHLRRRRVQHAGVAVLLMLLVLGAAGALQPDPRSGECGQARPVKAFVEDGRPLYLLSGQRGYDRARAQECFATEDAAREEGYAPAGP